MIIASLSKCSQHISQAILLSPDAQIRQNYKEAIKLMANLYFKIEMNPEIETISDCNGFRLKRIWLEKNWMYAKWQCNKNGRIRRVWAEWVQLCILHIWPCFSGHKIRLNLLRQRTFYHGDQWTWAEQSIHIRRATYFFYLFQCDCFPFVMMY